MEVGVCLQTALQHYSHSHTEEKSAFLMPQPLCLVLYVLNIFDKHFRISEDLRGYSCIHERNNLLSYYAAVHHRALHLCDEKRKH